MFLSGKTIIVSHWVFIFLILVTAFYDESHTYFSVFYAVIFGLLIDLVYTELLGIYMFSYAIVIYIVHQLNKLFQPNLYMMILVAIIGVSLADVTINLLYSVIGRNNLLWGSYAFYRLLPTILANIIFLILFYPIVKNQLIAWRSQQSKGRLF